MNNQNVFMEKQTIRFACLVAIREWLISEIANRRQPTYPCGDCFLSNH